MIYIDSRAGSQNLVEYSPLDTMAQLVTLPSADVMFTANGPDGPLLFGAEVKRIDDFINSQLTGRLVSQLELMQREYAIRRLMIYGNPHESNEGTLVYQSYNDLFRGRKTTARYSGNNGKPIPYKWFTGLCADIEMAGFHIDVCLTEADVVKLIVRHYEIWQKPWAARSYLHTVDRSAYMPIIPRYAANQEDHEHIRQAVKVIASIPGIGPKKALTILRHFGTVEAVIHADVKQLSKVDGMGPVGSKRIYDFIRRESF